MSELRFQLSVKQHFVSRYTPKVMSSGLVEVRHTSAVICWNYRMLLFSLLLRLLMTWSHLVQVSKRGRKLPNAERVWRIRLTYERVLRMPTALSKKYVNSAICFE